MSREIYDYKRYAIKAARELDYPTEIISRLRIAQSETEIEKIMVTARKGN